MNTVPFGPRNPPEDPLLAKAAGLPKDIEPPRDLWPAIAARIAEARQAPAKPAFRWPLALAAGFLIASVSALLTWSLLRDPQPPGVAVVAEAPADAAIVPVRYGPNSGVSAAELAARDALLREFQGAFATLRRGDPEEPGDHAGGGRRDRRRAREGPGERHAEGHAGRHVQAGTAVVFDRRHRA